MSNMMICDLAKFSLYIWLRFRDFSSTINCHKKSPFNFTMYFLTPTWKSKVKTFYLFQLNHSLQYRKNSKIIWKWGINSLFSICAKTQLNEDSFTLVKAIHTKLIHLQTILAIRHRRNWCLLCSNSTEQKKHIPLEIFLLFNLHSPIVMLQP